MSTNWTRHPKTFQRTALQYPRDPSYAVGPACMDVAAMPSRTSCATHGVVIGSPASGQTRCLQCLTLSCPREADIPRARLATVVALPRSHATITRRRARRANNSLVPSRTLRSAVHVSHRINRPSLTYRYPAAIRAPGEQFKPPLRLCTSAHDPTHVLAQLSGQTCPRRRSTRLLYPLPVRFWSAISWLHLTP